MKKISLALGACALLGFAACSDRENPNGAGDMSAVQNPPPFSVAPSEPVAPGMGDVVDTTSMGSTTASSDVSATETRSRVHTAKATKVKKTKKFSHYNEGYDPLNRDSSDATYDDNYNVGATSPSTGAEGVAVGSTQPSDGAYHSTDSASHTAWNPAAINSGH